MLYSSHNNTNMDKNITIYSTPTCHFCQMTKDFLKEKGIAYTEHNVASDLEKRQEMIQKSGQMGVPVIFVDNEMIVGFDKERLISTLRLTAYLPAPLVQWIERLTPNELIQVRLLKGAQIFFYSIHSRTLTDMGVGI